MEPTVDRRERSIDATIVEEWLSGIRGKFDRIWAERKEGRRSSAPDLSFLEMLGVERNERRHSAFLASLLDPLGSHAQGDLFLKAFLTRVDPCLAERSSNPDWFVATEHWFPGGLLDVVLRSSDTLIAIENKIDAGEGHGQLQTYDKWLKKQLERDKKLVYLTLHGSAPSSRVDCNLSYRDILMWLDSVAVPANAVRSLLDQYCRVVRQLLGGNTGMDECPEKLVDLLISRRNANISFEIAAAWQQVRRKLERKFWDDFLAQLKEQLGGLAVDWQIDAPTDRRLKDKNGPFVELYPRSLGGSSPRLYFCVQHWPERDRDWDYREYFGVAWRNREDSQGPNVAADELRNAVGLPVISKLETEWLACRERSFSIRGYDSESLPPIYEPARVRKLAEEMARMMSSNKKRLEKACA